MYKRQTVTNEYLYMNRINQMEDTEMVKIIMHGCNGAMGQVITKLAAEDKDAEITAGIDRVDNRENPYPVFTSCDACDVEADVIVDFSVAQAVDEMCIRDRQCLCVQKRRTVQCV